MTRGRVIRLSKHFKNEESSDEDFSNEESDKSSSEEETSKKKKTKSKKKKRKRYSDSSDVDDPSSDDSADRRKKTKKKSKYYKNSCDSSEEDAKEKEKERRRIAQEELKKRREEEERKRQELIKNSKLTILPLTEEQLKEQYKYRKHKCKLSEVPTKRSISGQDACRPGRPADLAVDKVKLHYVVHYIYRGIWDDIVPEEGDREGKIDSYICNACTNKRFKNYLEKQEYPGRGSSLCHVATDHGRLLSAMLNDKEVDMTEEIKALAKYDKQFNEIYRAFLDNGDNSFVLPDDEIITIKESLVWKIYQKPKNKENNVNNANRFTRPPVNAPEMTPEAKEAAKAVLSRSKPKRLHCPFKEFANCEYKGHEDGQAFRLHFFLHYKDKWSERIDSLVKGDKVYYCDICPSKKPSRGATPEGAKTAAICHLAIQHHELRGVMEKDERLSKDFINDVYYDVDLKKAQNAGITNNEPNKVNEVKNNSENKKDSEQKSKSPDKPKPSETQIVSEKSNETKKTPKPGPKSKTRPGPASKTKSKATTPVKTPNDLSDADVPELSDEEIIKPNKEYIRKRKKLVLTMEDLEPEASDEEFKTSSTPSQASRSMPKRSATKKPKIDTNESQSEEEIVPKRKSNTESIKDNYKITKKNEFNDENKKPKSTRQSRKRKVVTEFSDEDSD